MKRLVGLIVIAALFGGGCKGKKEGLEPFAAEGPEPIATVEQQIGTPLLGTDQTIEEPSLPTAVTPVVPLSPEKVKPPSTDIQALKATDVVPTISPTSETQSIPFTPRIVQAKTNIALILDASGSMGAPFGASSRTKFEVLRSAVGDVLEQAIAQTEFPRNIGVRIFGSESNLNAKNCQDTKQLYPMGEINLSEARRVLEKTSPQGMSPLSHSLQQAMRDFPPYTTDVDRVIVLVADGADSCEVDPCALIEELQQKEGKTMVHVIGFDISQEDLEKISCIAQKSDGRFFLARNENELLSALEESLQSTVPYNLKLTTLVGSTPVPTTVTVFRAGTTEALRTEHSFGTKFFNLPPTNYDIRVEYIDSLETKKPSKLVKGVELLADTKVEQRLSFELGELNLSSVNEKGELVPARYRILGSDGALLGEVTSQAEQQAAFLSPGTYDIVAERIDAGPEEYTLTEKGVELQVNITTTKEFRFQRGTLVLKGSSSQGKPLPFLFHLWPTGKKEQIIASGAFGEEGGEVLVAPGTYDIQLIGQDPTIPTDPRTLLTGIHIKAAKRHEQSATFTMGELELRAEDIFKEPVAASFEIRDHDSNEVLATIPFEKEKGAKKIPIPPGNYDFLVQLTEGITTPRPSVLLSNIRVEANKPAQALVRFELGKLRLRGRDSKENPISTKFTIYAASTDKVVMEAPTAKNWTVFDVAPGHYDVWAENIDAKRKDREPIGLWIRNVDVTISKTISHEAIFTAGKIKIIGRGPNNMIIPCSFKVFQYGSDRELIIGTTGNDWKVFDIQPGKYYIEAAYNDPDSSQLLKKWINIAIGENEVHEQVLRF